MKVQNLSVKRLFGRVAIGLVLSMSGITIVLFFVTKQTAVLLTGGALLLCALVGIFVLTQAFGKRLSQFTADLCQTLDHMIAGNEAPQRPEDSETQLARIGHRLARLYQIMQENRRRVDEERQELQTLVSDISHQVKTPVSNLKMATDTLLEKPMAEAERTDFIRGIRSQTDKLDFLFQALVKTSRLETGVIQLDKKPGRLFDTVAQAMSGIVYAAEKKEIAVSVDCPEDLTVSHDSKWTSEALFNLLDNAVKYTPAGGKIAVSVVLWEMLTSQSMPYSGDLPASENEIVVQESFLDSLGYSNELGQTIQIPFSDGTTHDFKLTGILDVKTGDIGRYTAIISKELVRQQYGDGGMIDYYIGLKGAQNMSEEEATNYANTLAQQLKISDDNVIVRSTYFNLKDKNHGSDMLFYFLIGFVTFIGSGIVIYSIFYISVASSIRNYGQLRTIGTTKRQIKKMVYREEKLLAAIAIPIGLVIGNVIGYFLIPAGWYWLTTLCVTVGVGLFAFIIVMIAIHTPVKRAAAVSPLEALRYSDYQGKMKESSVLHRKITPASLAKMNLSRQKAKSTLTILSLSLGGVLVVLISTMLVSYDGVAEARGRAFPVGEFNIQLNANQSWDTAGISLSGLQQKNFLNADFINAVESIDGVTGIKHWYYTDAEYRVNGNSGKWIQGFCRDEQQNLEKERIAGTTDYDELVAGNGIVLLQERADLYDIEAALGDTVEVDYKTESGQIRTKAYTVMGIVNEYSYSGFSKCFALPEQFMNEATGIDCTGTISVITDMKKYDTVEAALNQLIDGNSDLVMETIKESITYYSGLQQLSFGVLLIVAVIVVCFSLINLVNTTITNFLSRRQEIGMLQAIGLSKKQLIKMLCYEGLMYSVFATLVTLVLGTGLGFLSVQVVVKTMNPYFYYSFPWLIVLIYLAILLIVQFTLISYTTGNLKKQSLVEQIRTME